MRIHPTALILDYGNVLCVSPLAAEVQAMASILRLSAAEFHQRYWRFRPAYDDAALDPATYWNNLAQRQLPAVDIDQLQSIDSASWSHPHPVMPDWVRAVRQAGFRIGLLSNMPAPVRDYIVRCPWLPVFDQYTFSCELGLSKPSEAIYRHSLAGLDVAASDALFIDDRAENIRAAEALGIHSLLFSTPEALAPELNRRFAIGVSLAATLDRKSEHSQ